MVPKHLHFAIIEEEKFHELTSWYPIREPRLNSVSSEGGQNDQFYLFIVFYIYGNRTENTSIKILSDVAKYFCTCSVPVSVSLSLSLVLSLALISHYKSSLGPQL